MLTVFADVKEVIRVPVRPGPAAPSRRARVRDATVLEIRSTARSLLVEKGPDALTLRAIAREMGMSPPALYRYFASHDEIVAAVVHDVLEEITATLVSARDAAAGDPVERLLATCRAFRAWSLAHPREFQLTFASLVDGSMAHDVGDVDGGGLSFGAVFLEIFVEIWAHQPFQAPAESDLPVSLTEQLRRFSAATGDRLPLGVLAAYLSGWVRLYGAVTIEVFGHLGFALQDAESMFEAMLGDMRRQLTTKPT